jgi:hypothetical protein
MNGPHPFGIFFFNSGLLITQLGEYFCESWQTNSQLGLKRKDNECQICCTSQCAKIPQAHLRKLHVLHEGQDHARHEAHTFLPMQIQLQKAQKNQNLYPDYREGNFLCNDSSLPRFKMAFKPFFPITSSNDLMVINPNLLG